jgi:thioredoxin reductase (NADPH)
LAQTLRPGQHYSKDQPLFVTGDIAPGMFVLKAGHVKVTRRDPLGHLAPIVKQGPGDFVAEVGQLSGRPKAIYQNQPLGRIS